MLIGLLSVALAMPPKCSSIGSPKTSSTMSVERVGFLRTSIWLGLRFYQVAISPADGAGCTMYPSCSRYAIESVERNGPIMGMWMGASRILADHGADPHRHVCLANGRLFLYNPPEEDEWWL
jgi:putative component of membrane protein insertase Oxa1/YidC/SpoIIIJ protein YidD